MAKLLEKTFSAFVHFFPLCHEFSPLHQFGNEVLFRHVKNLSFLLCFIMGFSHLSLKAFSLEFELLSFLDQQLESGILCFEIEWVVTYDLYFCFKLSDFIGDSNSFIVELRH